MSQQPTEEDTYFALSEYTLLKHDPEFIHQYVVDAYAASTAQNSDKPIRIAFALMGLYLHREKNYTGRQVQLAHIHVANHKKEIPQFSIPAEKPKMNATDVMQEKPGEQRDKAIVEWSKAVWEIWKPSHKKVKEWVDWELGL